MTVRFGSVPPLILRNNPLRGGQWPPTTLPIPPTSREDLQLDEYLERILSPMMLRRHYAFTNTHAIRGFDFQTLTNHLLNKMDCNYKLLSSESLPSPEHDLFENKLDYEAQIIGIVSIR
ncbi:hypothetical protein TNCV_881631 [Trichonephila clavipes]|nr:hypothetical protein TNCV_881631 [Trichonephila clavipes]